MKNKKEWRWSKKDKKEEEDDCHRLIDIFPVPAQIQAEAKSDVSEGRHLSNLVLFYAASIVYSTEDLVWAGQVHRYDHFKYTIKTINASKI
ncbi:hypothetical protein OIU76_003069 [Salix suchowensis]|nr:hypothetical protein OIU76_003069 [Salix suchowensis]